MSLVFRTAVWLCVTGAWASAQERSFRVSGEVTDSTGAVVVGAKIALYSRGAPAAFSTDTGERGSYALTVPAGEYLMEASAPGLTLPDSPRHIAVKGALNLPLRLGIAQGAASVVVTATGTPQSLEETAKAVETVGREELERRNTVSIIDGLREVPGMRISQRGGPGGFATVQIRGLRTFDTGFLIDGMRFRDVGATQGDASSFIGDLLVVDTTRVEILQGTGSSLYGTNATGGVVNIVTDAGGGAFHGSINADGGGLGEFRGGARFGGGAWSDRFHYSAGAAHLNVTQGVDGNDPYRNTTGNGLVDYSFRPGMVLSGRLLATDTYLRLNETPSSAPAKTLPGSARIPAVPLAQSQILLAQQGLPYALGNATFLPALNDPDYYQTSRFLSAMAALQHQLNPALSYRLSYQALLTDRNVVNGPAGPGFQPPFRDSSQFNGRIDTLEGRVNLLAGAHHLLTAGYEFEREAFDSPAYDTNPNPAQRVNSRTKVSERSHAFEAQDQLRLFKDRLQISLSGRVQLFNLSKPVFLGSVPVYANAQSISPASAYTGDISIAYFLKASGTKIRSHGGNGYREPSLYERFGTYFSGGSFTAYGDPRLKPERSVAIDGGIDQYFASDRVRLSGTYFYTRLQQVIAFDFSGLINAATDAFGRSQGYRNTSGGLARGVELSAEAKPWRSLVVKSSYTYTNARDRFSQFSDGTLQTPRIYPHAWSLVLLQQFGRRWDAAFDFFAASDYLYPLSRHTFVFRGPRTAGLSAGYTHPLGERWKLRLYARVTNLADQQYYDDGWRTPGRFITGGMKVSF